MAHGQAHQHHRPLWRRRRVDSTARLLADKLGERLKQSVVVDNVTGAGGTIGLARARRPRPTATPW
jgi:tripartite-type tricarboxylate transporter receptor subunit TctC